MGPLKLCLSESAVWIIFHCSETLQSSQYLKTEGRPTILFFFLFSLFFLLSFLFQNILNLFEAKTPVFDVISLEVPSLATFSLSRGHAPQWCSLTYSYSFVLLSHISWVRWPTDVCTYFAKWPCCQRGCLDGVVIITLA